METSTGCGSSCGCDAAEDQEPAIVCLLSGREAHEQRLADFARLFVLLERTEPLPGRFRWYFRAETEQAETLIRNLAAEEQRCCPFFRFTIRREGQQVVWEASAPEGAGEVLAAFMLLPETLRVGVDAATLKASLTQAGLHFVEDGRAG